MRPFQARSRRRHTEANCVQNTVTRPVIGEKSLRCFEVLEARGHIEDSERAHWQVRVKIGATLD